MEQVTNAFFVVYRQKSCLVNYSKIYKKDWLFLLEHAKLCSLCYYVELPSSLEANYPGLKDYLSKTGLLI